MAGTLRILAVFVAIPLLLLILGTLLAWRYRRLLEAATRPTGEPPLDVHDSLQTASRTSRPALLLTNVSAARSAAPSGATKVFTSEAQLSNRRVAIAFSVATLVYAALVDITIVASLEPRVPLDARIVALYLLQAPILLVPALILSAFRVHLIRVFAVYVLIGLVVCLLTASPARAYRVVLAELEIFMILPCVGIAVALLCTKRMQPVLGALAAIALFLAINVAIGQFLESQGVDTLNVRPIIWIFGAINLVFGIVVFGWLIGRDSIRGPIVGLCAMAGAGIVIEWAWGPALPFGAPLAGVPVIVIQLFLVWLAFRLNVWLQGHHLLTSEALQSHGSLMLLSAYFTVLVLWGAGLFRQHAWSAVAVAAAFVCYVAVLHLLLYRVWRERWNRPAIRLLLLRVFGSWKRSERLLDALEDTWRRVGQIDLIAGVDLGLRTIDSGMLEAFLTRRSGEHTVRTAADMTRALQQMRSALEGDARYPVNELVCSGESWRHAVAHLARDADVVLMDMRGFTRDHAGCVFELTEIITHVRLSRVVVVADATTDREALNEIAQAAWRRLPLTSPNAVDSGGELKVFSFVGPHDVRKQGLFESLLEAATSRSHENTKAARMADSDFVSS